MYQRVRLRSSHAGLQWHVPCCMHTILVYHCNKQASNVFLSIQFDTNVSQLLRHVLPCLMILFHLSVNCLGVVWIDCLYVCRVCFDCATHQWCTVGIYCASASSEWPFFSIFFKKKWKKNLFSSEKMATRRQQRQSICLPYTTGGIHSQNKHDRHWETFVSNWIERSTFEVCLLQW